MENAPRGETVAGDRLRSMPNASFPTDAEEKDAALVGKSTSPRVPSAPSLGRTRLQGAMQRVRLGQTVEKTHMDRYAERAQRQGVRMLCRCVPRQFLRQVVGGWSFMTNDRSRASPQHGDVSFRGLVQGDSAATASLRPGVWSHWGVISFLDLSGYTRLAEALARKKRKRVFGGELSQRETVSAGAEELIQVLNVYFGAAMSIIHHFGGDVVKFAGDAMLVWWPLFEDMEGGALNGSTDEATSNPCLADTHGLPVKQATRRLLAERAQAATKAGVYVLRAMRAVSKAAERQELPEMKIKIGVTAGRVHSFLVGGAMGRFEFFISGRCVEESGEMADLSGGTHVVLGSSAQALLQGPMSPDGTPGPPSRTTRSDQFRDAEEAHDEQKHESPPPSPARTSTDAPSDSEVTQGGTGPVAHSQVNAVDTKPVEKGADEGGSNTRSPEHLHGIHRVDMQGNVTSTSGAGRGRLLAVRASTNASISDDTVFRDLVEAAVGQPELRQFLQRVLLGMLPLAVGDRILVGLEASKHSSGLISASSIPDPTVASNHSGPDSVHSQPRSASNTSSRPRPSRWRLLSNLVRPSRTAPQPVPGGATSPGLNPGLSARRGWEEERRPSVSTAPLKSEPESKHRVLTLNEGDLSENEDGVSVADPNVRRKSSLEQARQSKLAEQLTRDAGQSLARQLAADGVHVSNQSLRNLNGLNRPLASAASPVRRRGRAGAIGIQFVAALRRGSAERARAQRTAPLPPSPRSVATDLSDSADIVGKSVTFDHKGPAWLADSRRVSVAFFLLPGLPCSPGNIAQVQGVVAAIQGGLYAYGGSLRQFMVDDKGQVAVCAFGLGNDGRTATRAVLACQMISRRLTKIGVAARVGIATGTCFAGMLGSHERSEFTLAGDFVNLAARLMGTAHYLAEADTDSVVLCEPRSKLEASREIEFEHVVTMQLKGKSDPVMMFAPKFVLDHTGDGGEPRRMDFAAVAAADGREAFAAQTETKTASGAPDVQLRAGTASRPGSEDDMDAVWGAPPPSAAVPGSVVRQQSGGSFGGAGSRILRASLGAEGRAVGLAGRAIGSQLAAQRYVRRFDPVQQTVLKVAAVFCVAHNRISYPILYESYPVAAQKAQLRLVLRMLVRQRVLRAWVEDTNPVTTDRRTTAMLALRGRMHGTLKGRPIIDGSASPSRLTRSGQALAEFGARLARDKTMGRAASTAPLPGFSAKPASLRRPQPPRRGSALGTLLAFRSSRQSLAEPAPGSRVILNRPAGSSVLLRRDEVAKEDSEVLDVLRRGAWFSAQRLAPASSIASIIGGVPVNGFQAFIATINRKRPAGDVAPLPLELQRAVQDLEREAKAVETTHNEDVYAFRHTQASHVLYSTVLPAQVRDAHLAMALAIEQRALRFMARHARLRRDCAAILPVLYWIAQGRASADVDSVQSGESRDSKSSPQNGLTSELSRREITGVDPSVNQGIDEAKLEEAVDCDELFPVSDGMGGRWGGMSRHQLLLRAFGLPRGMHGPDSIMTPAEAAPSSSAASRLPQPQPRDDFCGAGCILGEYWVEAKEAVDPPPRQRRVSVPVAWLSDDEWARRVQSSVKKRGAMVDSVWRVASGLCSAEELESLAHHWSACRKIPGAMHRSAWYMEAAGERMLLDGNIGAAEGILGKALTLLRRLSPVDTQPESLPFVPVDEFYAAQHLSLGNCSLLRASVPGLLSLENASLLASPLAGSAPKKEWGDTAHSFQQPDSGKQEADDQSTHLSGAYKLHTTTAAGSLVSGVLRVSTVQSLAALETMASEKHRARLASAARLGAHGADGAETKEGVTTSATRLNTDGVAGGTLADQLRMVGDVIAKGGSGIVGSDAGRQSLVSRRKMELPPIAIPGARESAKPRRTFVESDDGDASTTPSVHGSDLDATLAAATAVAGAVGFAATGQRVRVRGCPCCARFAMFPLVRESGSGLAKVLHAAQQRKAESTGAPQSSTHHAEGGAAEPNAGSDVSGAVVDTWGQPDVPSGGKSEADGDAEEGESDGEDEATLRGGALRARYVEPERAARPRFGTFMSRRRGGTSINDSQAGALPASYRVGSVDVASRRVASVRVLLAKAMLSEGRTTEALRHLRLAAKRYAGAPDLVDCIAAHQRVRVIVVVSPGDPAGKEFLSEAAGLADAGVIEQWWRWRADEAWAELGTVPGRIRTSSIWSQRWSEAVLTIPDPHAAAELVNIYKLTLPLTPPPPGPGMSRVRMVWDAPVGGTAAAPPVGFGVCCGSSPA